jgi:hypothetical protein
MGLGDERNTPQTAAAAPSAPARALHSTGRAADGMAPVSPSRRTLHSVAGIAGITIIIFCRYRSAAPSSMHFGVSRARLPVHEWQATAAQWKATAVELSDDYIVLRSPAASLVEGGMDDPENQLGACQQQHPQLAGMTERACEPRQCLWSSAQGVNVDMWFHAFTPVDNSIISSSCDPPTGGQLPVHPPHGPAEVSYVRRCHVLLFSWAFLPHDSHAAADSVHPGSLSQPQPGSSGLVGAIPHCGRGAQR